jgi:hypothetical protein
MKTASRWRLGIIGLFVGSQVSLALANGVSLGVSTTQVLVGLPTFSLREAPLADGRARRLGQTTDGKATLELTGPKDNLTRAYLLVTGTATRDNTALLMRFIQNAVPEWSGRDAWVRSTLKQIAQSPARTTVGARVVEMERNAALGALTVTIRAASSAATAGDTSARPPAPSGCHNSHDINERISVVKACYAHCGGDAGVNDAAGECFEACCTRAFCGTGQ